MAQSNAARFEPCELCERPAECRDDAKCGGFFDEAPAQAPDPRDAEIARLRKAISQFLVELDFMQAATGRFNTPREQGLRDVMKGTDDAK